MLRCLFLAVQFNIILTSMKYAWTTISMNPSKYNAKCFRINKMQSLNWLPSFANAFEAKDANVNIQVYITLYTFKYIIHYSNTSELNNGIQMVLIFISQELYIFSLSLSLFLDVREKECVQLWVCVMCIQIDKMHVTTFTWCREIK